MTKRLTYTGPLPKLFQAVGNLVKPGETRTYLDSVASLLLATGEFEAEKTSPKPKPASKLVSDKSVVKDASSKT